MHLKLLFTTPDKTELDVRKLWTCFTFSSLLLIPVVHSVVFNYKSQECAPCFCAKESNPLCVNENDDKKKFVTYENPCEFMCTALCNEYATKFMYCGKCDNRTLPLFGQKGNAEDFDCLGFVKEVIVPAGPGSASSESGEDWTNAPSPVISADLKAQLKLESPPPPPDSMEDFRSPASKGSSENLPATKGSSAEHLPAPPGSSAEDLPAPPGSSAEDLPAPAGSSAEHLPTPPPDNGNDSGSGETE